MVVILYCSLKYSPFQLLHFNILFQKLQEVIVYVDVYVHYLQAMMQKTLLYENLGQINNQDADLRFLWLLLTSMKFSRWFF